MATTRDIPRSASPEPDAPPRPALGAGASTDFSRCLSTASSVSHGSATDISLLRESLGSDTSGFSRHSSASFATSRRSDASSRYSTMSMDRPASKRRGYMRPQTTDFAASAKSRESVLSLGSIAHLQYYFARTGLLDGKGAQLARKRQQKAHTLDLSQLDPASYLSPNMLRSPDTESFASIRSSPELMPQGLSVTSSVMGSPVYEGPSEDEMWDLDDFEEPDPNMLPPTVSTYNHRQKHIPKPPTIAELKADLKAALDSASKGIAEAKVAKEPTDEPPTPIIRTPEGRKVSTPGWCEVQGMHILDVMTLAIRAAKVYYTSHEHPDRLDAIKPEKEVRSELLGTMDVLKRMAGRGFIGGIRSEEVRAMEDWIEGLYNMLSAEEQVEASERKERSGWRWMDDAQWTDPARAVEREHAFLQDMLKDAPPADGIDEPLPDWTPIDQTKDLDAQSLPTPFLRHMQNGIRLVQLHNCAVRKSLRRFGAIPTFHSDTQKPYRSADNIRYWAKAAELRWEVMIKVDALGIVCDNTGPEVWVDFENAILKWCRAVRTEIANEQVD